jgi:hypothetical protein
MFLAHYLGLLHRAEDELARAFEEVADAHRDEADVHILCARLAKQCREHAAALGPFAERYGEEADPEPERLHSDLFGGTRSGPMALLRDLHDLYLMTCEADITWTGIGQAAQGARDEELLAVVRRCEGETAAQLRWVRSRIKQAAPQVLVVAR